MLDGYKPQYQIGSEKLQKWMWRRCPERKSERNKTTEKQPGETTNENENGNEKINETGNLEKKVASKRRAFVAPTLEEVADFFGTIKGTRTDAERFFYHYETTGWRTNKGCSLKSWQAAAHKWMLNERKYTNTKAPETSCETQPRYKAL